MEQQKSKTVLVVLINLPEAPLILEVDVKVVANAVVEKVKKAVENAKELAANVVERVKNPDVENVVVKTTHSILE